VVAAIGISLGNWQERRAAQKHALQQQIVARAEQPPLQAAALPPAAQPEEFRRIVADGQFIADWPLYLENRPLDGRAGFYLLMPFRLAGSAQVVLVQRGWFARDARDRTRIPPIPTPAGLQQISGRVRSDTGQVMQLGERAMPAPGAILQNFDLQIFAVASKMPVHAFIIEQSSDTRDGLRRDWPQPSFGIDTHRGYAFQWYALAAAALLFFVITGCKRVSH
jgi:cytochrome oxidase assembly protein ShyY1